MSKTALAMPNLRKYVEGRNRYRKLAKQELFNLAFMTPAMFRQLEMALEGDLSPENLCCDGEASPSYVRQRSKYLNAVKAELKVLKDSQ